MRNIVFDSYALIAHFIGEKGHETVSELLSEITIGEKQGYISLINVGEIYYMIHRKVGEKAAEKAISIISEMNIEIAPVDLDLTIAAAKLKAKNKLSYADAFAAALTIKTKAVLITGDKEFKNLEGETNFKAKFI